MNNSVMQKGTYIELSEHRNYLELSNLVCFYNEASLNLLQLDYGETDDEKAETLEKAQTLCMMPVYAKVTVNSKNEPTFAGHEAVRKMNGEVIYKTVPIGVHESVAIEDHEVEIPSTGETKTLPCLVAKQRIWTRNKNAVAAIKRLFAEGHLHNSFEMEVSQYVFDNGIRHAKEYEFIGNAFLASDSVLRGASVKPAYGNSARVTEVAQAEPDYELELAEALAIDMAENKEVNEMLENEIMQEETQIEESAKKNPEEETHENEVTQEEKADPVTEAEYIPEQESSEEVEQESVEQENSALTDRDIRTAIEGVYNQQNERYAHVCFVFPEEHIAWLHQWEMRETEFIQVTYAVDGNTLTLGESQPVEIVLPIRELSAAYKEQSEKVESLTKEVSELTPYKEKVVAEEAAAAKAKHEKEVASLRALAESAGVFTTEELAEMNDLFEQVKTNDVKAAIFDKQSAMMNKTVETSTTEETIEQPKANLEHEDHVSGIGAVRRFLNI